MSTEVEEAARPLIQSKLEPPVPRQRVSRRELLELCAGPRPRKLTLIRAPAGWGKSTLLADWHALESETRPFAWVALDDGDNDPVRFWTYLIHALRTLDPRAGEVSLPMLRAPRVSVVDDVLPALCNELTALPHQVVLVLDDYHLVSNPEIDEGLSFLLEHLPQTLELVLSSRSEPALPLARLRARGELAEIDAQQLRFSEDEADLFLNDLHGLGLDRDDVIRLRELHGGMGGRSLPRDAYHPRPGKRARVHRGLCGQQPPCRRLPELGGARRPPRRDEGLPAPYVGARTPLRLPLRRRHRPTWLGADAARARAVELFPNPPRHEARVVRLPPPLSRATAPSARARRARARSDAASPGQRMAPKPRRPVRGDSSRHGGKGLRRCLRADPSPLDRVSERGSPRDPARLARWPPARDGDRRCPAVPREGIDAARGRPDRRGPSVARSGRTRRGSWLTPGRPGLCRVRCRRVPGNQSILPRGRDWDSRDGTTRPRARGSRL